MAELRNVYRFTQKILLDTKIQPDRKRIYISVHIFELVTYRSIFIYY